MKRVGRFAGVFFVGCLAASALIWYTMRPRWEDSLQRAVQGATRLRVRSGGTCHRDPSREKALVEITDAAQIDRVVKGIDIDWLNSGRTCMCCGNPTFEFYAGDKLLAMIGYHHGRNLRWGGGPWRGDGALTASSQRFLNSWLSQHGVTGPQAEVDRMQEQKDRETRNQQRYTELIPPATLAAVAQAQSSREISPANDPRQEKRRKLIADAFIKHEHDAQADIAVYLRMLGVTRDYAWNRYDSFDSIVTQHLLPRFKGADLAAAAVAVMKDEEGLAGAARWFFGEKGWRNLDESDRQRILLPVAEWGLRHRYMNTRKWVMTDLTEINTAWATDLVRGMLARPTEAGWTPPNNPYGPSINVGGGEKVYEDECSDAVWAAFCLAKMGDVGSEAAIRKLADASQGRDKELLGKAIQLLRSRRQGHAGHQELIGSGSHLAGFKPAKDSGGHDSAGGGSMSRIDLT